MKLAAAIAISTLRAKPPAVPAPEPEAPTNSVPPSVAGNTTIGSTLTITPGIWGGVPDPTFAYKWQRNSVDIAGATSLTYILQNADAGTTIRAVETATNSEGSASANSNNIAVPAVPPVNSVAPVVSGVAAVDEVLSCTPGTWTGFPAPSLSYAWQTDGAPNGVTGNSYTVQVSDVGLDITCVVTGTNSGGSANATSNIISIP